MATPAQWSEEIRAAERTRRTRSLKTFARENWPPPIEVVDRLLALLDLIDREPSANTIKLADAFEEFPELEREHGYSRALEAVCRKYSIKAKVFEKVLAKNRHDVNAVLRERGLLSAKFSNYEVTSGAA
jgi:hypothetical protein